MSQFFYEILHINGYLVHIIKISHIRDLVGTVNT